MPILLRLQPLMQVDEVALEDPPVSLLGDSIHTHRTVLSDPAVGPRQGRHIQQVRQ